MLLLQVTSGTGGLGDNTSILEIILGVLLFIIFFGCYFGICALVGKYAKNRGRSFGWLFVISIFFGPLIGFIIAALLGESYSFREERIRRETRIRMEEEDRYRKQYYQEKSE